MNSRTCCLVNAICLLAGLAVFGLVACNRDPGPPAPLAVGQIPAELQEAFDQARPEAKDIVGRITSALREQDYPAAYEEVQTLSTLPEETSQQREVGARALLTLTGLLQSAQAQGDEKAATALRLRQMNR